MREQSSLYRRLFRYGKIVVGHGWETLVFWVATVYSLYTVFASVEFQKRVLMAVHIDPNQRFAVLGFGLAAFFFYAGFRAWSEAEGLIGNNQEDVPLLSVHSSGWSFHDRMDPKDLPYLLAFSIEILNRGAPTSLHDWHGLYTLNDGSNTVLSEKDFDRHRHILARNLVSDDKTIDRGGKCLGFVRFQVSLEVARAMKRVAIQFRDHTDNQYSVESDVRL